LFLQGVIGPLLASGVILLSGAVAAMRWNGGFLVYLVAFPIFIAMLAFVSEPKKPNGDALNRDRRLTAAKEDASALGLSAPFPMGSAAIVATMTLFSSALYYVFIVNGSIAFGEIGVTDPSEVGRLSFIPSLFIMVGALLFRLLSGRSNAMQLGAFLGILGLGLTAIGLAATPGQMVVGLALQQTGAGMAVVILVAWAQTKFPFEHRGRGMGIWTGAFFFGQFSSPWLVHKLSDALGSMQSAFVATGCAALVVMVGALAVAASGRSLKPQQQAD
jgi:MFS family permease